jgi:DNA-binding NarL/FixJ family response regulator
VSKAKIIIVDDHPLVRVGLKEVINKDPDLSVVAEAGDGGQLMDILSSRKCDLIVTDIAMPNIDGLVALKQVHSKYPKIKVLVLSMMKDYQHFQQAIGYGASGYLVKDDVADQLVLAIKCILKGSKFVSPSVSKVLVDRQLRAIENGEVPSLEILTRREKQILSMIAQGLANKNIASKLKISNRTVEHHRFNLTEKLGFKTPAALVNYARTKGLV